MRPGLQGLSRDRSADAGLDRLGRKRVVLLGDAVTIGLMVDSTAGGTGSLVQGTTRGMAMAGGGHESTQGDGGTKASGLRVEAGVKAGMTVKIAAGVGTAVPVCR